MLDNSSEAVDGRSRSMLALSQSNPMMGSSVSGRRKLDIINDIKKKLLVKHGADKVTETAIDNMLREFNQKEKITLKDFA